MFIKKDVSLTSLISPHLLTEKLIIIYLLFIFFLVVYLFLILDSPLDNHLVLKA